MENLFTGDDFPLIFSTGLALEGHKKVASEACLSTDTGGPREGDEYDIYTFPYSMIVLPGISAVKFDYQFATEELNSHYRAEIDPQKYDDKFELLFTAPDETTTNLALLPNGEPMTVFNAFRGNFLRPAPHTIPYSMATDTYSKVLDLEPFVGQVVRLTARVADVGDALVDSAGLLSNFSLIAQGGLAALLPTEHISSKQILEWIT